MQEAAALNRADCIHILLEYDADTNVANDQGVTPLHEVRPSRECCFSYFSDSKYARNLDALCACACVHNIRLLPMATSPVCRACYSTAPIRTKRTTKALRRYNAQPFTERSIAPWCCYRLVPSSPTGIYILLHMRARSLSHLRSVC